MYVITNLVFSAAQVVAFRYPPVKAKLGIPALIDAGEKVKKVTEIITHKPHVTVGETAAPVVPTVTPTATPTSSEPADSSKLTGWQKKKHRK